MPTDPSSTLVPRLRLAGVVVGACAVIAVGWGVFARARDTHDLKAWTDQQAVPTVQTVNPAPADGQQGLDLPGSLQAYNEAPIYARVSGYLKSWNEDIGAHVKAGQLLAVIDAPELDQQLAEAKANLATVVANQKLAQVTARRFTDLAADDAVSKQDADEKSGDLAAKSAVVQASKANVDRLEALEGFKRIVAPFDGVVTQRTANIGALVNAGAGSNAATALFSVADVHKLRVYVQVPQSASAQIHGGETAKLSLPQFPGRTFPAKVVRDAGAVGQSGALLVELEVDNPDAGLKPGDYAQVRFSLPGQAGTVRVPASTLIFRRNGLQVAVLQRDDRVKLQTVTVARDFGGQVELSGGVQPSDRVIDNPPDSLEDGDVVRVGHAQG
jgi:RND family efflux transporter MFP subunit